jgi:hypothetical protein
MKQITLSLFLLTVGLAGCKSRGTEGGLPGLDIEARIDNLRPFALGEIAESSAFIPLDIADNRDRITDPDLKAIAKGISGESNPVVVVATLKK